MRQDFGGIAMVAAKATVQLTFLEGEERLR
jgi:hypothetical protein